MAWDAGDIKTMNSSKEIDLNTTLPAIIFHRNAFEQARTGNIPGEEKKYNTNQRKMNQVKALNLIIGTQRQLITISRPIIYFRSFQKWKKNNKTDEEKEKKPFNEEGMDVYNMKYDYFKLKYWLDFLKHCEDSILEAERTASKDDDFLVVKNGVEGDINVLTKNFYEMLDALESSYEQIYLLMLTNKIVSAGIEEDEEMSYKEQEAEAIRRVKEA